MSIADEINFIAKNITREKEVHFIMMRGSIHPEGTKSQICTSLITVSKYMKQN